MIDPADMLLFVAVVREGSFTRAASALGLTKQSVSERVAKLERQLGVRLLARTTRTLRATDAGAAYYARASLIAAQIEEANREAQRAQSEPSGILRVSAPVLYGRRYMMPLLTELLEKYPKLRVDLVLADRRVSLIEEGFDLAIRVGELDDSTLNSKKIGDGYVYFIASPAYLKRHGRPHSALDLREAQCIATKPNESWEVSGKQVKIEPRIIVNDLESACDAALAGLGVARLPSLVCGEYVRAKRLIALFEETAWRREIHAVYPSRQYLPPKVRIFLEALSANTALLEPLQPRGRSRL
jgi:DNA-binding transcriptional LysR family regulator